MPARRRVALRQVELLVDFAESQRDVALGRFPGGPLAAQRSRAVWESVALRLNSIADGVTRSGDQWRRYWIELKAKTKCKAADARRSAAATGGGPSRLVPLTELEQRLLAIIGPVAVEGLPGVRLPIDITSVDEPMAPVSAAEPVPHPVHHPVPDVPVPSADCSTTISEPMVEEWLDDGPVQESATTPPPSADIQPAEIQSASVNMLGRAQPSTGPIRRARFRRQFPADERAPRWAYEIESRRVAAEERQAAAVEGLVKAVQENTQMLQEIARQQANSTEALVNILRAMDQR